MKRYHCHEILEVNKQSMADSDNAVDEFAGHMTLEEFHDRIQFNSGIYAISIHRIQSAVTYQTSRPFDDKEEDYSVVSALLCTRSGALKRNDKVGLCHHFGMSSQRIDLLLASRPLLVFSSSSNSILGSCVVDDMHIEVLRLCTYL